MCVPATTVDYVRYPGNSFDRQYAQFYRPHAAWHEDTTAEEPRYDSSL
jgi:hypothetical protein